MKTDPKYLVRHCIESETVYNTLFTSRLEMRKFIETLRKKYKKNLNYKVLTIFDCHSENSETWCENEIFITNSYDVK